MGKLICVACAGTAFAEATTPFGVLKPGAGAAELSVAVGGRGMEAGPQAARHNVNTSSAVQNIFFIRDPLFRGDLHVGAHSPTKIVGLFIECNRDFVNHVPAYSG